MITYLFLFSVLTSATDAVYFRVTYADLAACESARSSVIARRYVSGGEEIGNATLAICSDNPELPKAIAMGTLPIETLTP